MSDDKSAAVLVTESHPSDRLRELIEPILERMHRFAPASDDGYAIDSWAEEIAEALSLVRASQPSEGWQDISTAPKDGTHILVSREPMLTTSVHWFDDSWQLSVNYIGDHSDYVEHWGQPTHWMPLPSLVRASEDEKNDQSRVDKGVGRPSAGSIATTNEVI